MTRTFLDGLYKYACGLFILLGQSRSVQIFSKDSVVQVCQVHLTSSLFRMRSSLFYAALCAPSALAFPWMTPEGMGNLLNHPEARQEINRRLEELDRRVPEEVEHHEARQLGTGLLGGVGTSLGGTLGAVVDNVLGLIPSSESVNGLQRFPEGRIHLTGFLVPISLVCSVLT